MATPQLFRFRLLLRAKSLVTLQAHHGASVYATLAVANGMAFGAEPALPDGVLIDSPEQCRLQVRPGERYAFGFTLIADDATEAAGRVEHLSRGLATLGATPPVRGRPAPAWGGNFDVAGVEDLVAGQAWSPGQSPESIPAAMIEEESERVAAMSSVALRFRSPLRARRGSSDKATGHSYFDRGHFDADVFLRRLWGRLAGLGFLPADSESPASTGVRAGSNSLVWIDLAYGPASRRKTLGGAVGRVVIERVTAGMARALVLGQYLRAGESTRFGFGAYRIEALGPEPYPCERSAGLLDLAFGPEALDRAAEVAELDPGRLRHLADQATAGTYRPSPSTIIDIPDPDGDGPPRRLAVPSRDDRAMQRLVLDRLASGLDLFFEESSLAFRKGLGRRKAAEELARAWRDGYRWAARSDIHRFFDEIPHDELRPKLEAYLADPAAVALLMSWVEAGATGPGRGLPTGAPVSPMLSNLFLDNFDEEIAREGGRLIRYADDFLVLTREPAAAQRLLEHARVAAERLALALNEEKSGTIDLGSPFEFLGYRFEKRGRWEVRAGPMGRVLRVEELGWRDARPSASTRPSPRPLPGESEAIDPPDDGPCLIAGPGTYTVTLVDGRLVCASTGVRVAPPVPVEQLEEVILLGEPTIEAAALRVLASRGVPVLIADDKARLTAMLVGERPLEDPLVLEAQVALAGDEGRRLLLARPLIAAKLRNYAALADAWPSRRRDDSADALRDLANRALQATSLGELLGLEGAGAARWFASFGDRLPQGWSFERRSAPDADDPVNVLINIAQTALHRWAWLAVRAAGLRPGLGVLHRPRVGHAALASDFQEPFRHLMDRAVLELLTQLRPSDIRRATGGPFSLVLQPVAARQVAAGVALAMRRGMTSRGSTEPRSYRRHLVAMARSYRRAIVDPATPWDVFEYPTGP